MIWLIVLGLLLFYGGYILCGLLTSHRIKQLESLLTIILEADTKKREEEIRFVRMLFKPGEANERIRSQSKRTH